MANPNTAHEPSMEEILASIRQIISEDGDGSSPLGAEHGAGVQRVDPPQPSAEPAPYETVVSRLEGEPAPEPAPSVPRPSYSEAVAPQPAAARYDPPAPPSPVLVPRRQIQQEEEGALLSPEKSAMISGAFGALTQSLIQNSRTLEDVVAETLQPMLKSWLDDNLPSLVERMVKEEIERVSRGRR